MPITNILERNAELYADEVCLIERRYDVINEIVQTDVDNNHRSLGYITRRLLTWKEFDQCANQVANLLFAHSINIGDKVAIMMRNCLEWLPIYFGILKAGAIAVPLNTNITSGELQYCLTHAECALIFFASEFTDIVSSVVRQVPTISSFIVIGDTSQEQFESFNDSITAYSNLSPNITFTDNDFAAIYYSSGTTGVPKAILHTHGTLMSSGETELHHHQQTHEDVFVCIPPLYHTGAKMHWLGSLFSAGKAVLLCNISPQWILETMSQEKATIVWLLLPWAQDILDAISNGDILLQDYDFSHWRLTHMGAQPIPQSVIIRWLNQFPFQDYDTNYGLTEAAGPGCVHLGMENRHKAGSIGKAGYNWRTSIYNERKTSVKPGEIGELAVKGKGVMFEYYKDPEATSKTIQDGWLLTGDMAYEDEEGFIFLVDRKKDMIISGGENIYPVQIENYLRMNPAVKDVAVIGLPDDRLGEMVAAIIELKTGIQCSKTEIRRYCRDLPQYMRPYRIYFSEIPRNATGKIEKEKLRKQYAIKKT